MLDDLMHALALYALAIAISMAVALVMKGIVVSLSWSSKKPPAATPVPAAAPPEPAESDVPVIAAAAYAVLGATRILHIEDEHRGTGWTQEGRRIHQTSHAVARQSNHRSR